MRKRRTLLVFSTCLLLLATLLSILLREQEPSYQGRTLSQWHANWVRARETKDQHSEAVAADAIRQIGSNAVPFLLTPLQREHRATRNRIARSMPWQLRQIILPLLISTNKAEPTSTFAILGPLAAPAVPNLTRFLHATNEPSLNIAAAYCLAAVGPEGVPPLLGALTDPKDPSFRAAVHVLAIRSVPDTTRFAQAVPVLASRAAGLDPLDAIRALGRIKQEPAIAIPALTARLDWKHPLMAIYAMRSILEFGPQYVPALLTNRDDSVRQAATNALQTIAPELLTNAPAQ